MTNVELLKIAHEAMNNAYAPYSGFKVGAALLTRSGKVYTGCNIENSSFGITNCAERTALFKAVSEGEREFVCIAIIGGKDGKIEDACYPCGACRQALSEFVNNSFKFIFEDSRGNVTSAFMEDLLPCSFNL